MLLCLIPVCPFIQNGVCSVYKYFNGIENDLYCLLTVKIFGNAA